MFRNGRISLVIGLTVVAISVIAGDLVATMLADTRFGSVMRESLLIGGWVAMWRPLEIFLYEWWPVRADARLFDRLSAMTVRVARHDHEHDPASASGRAPLRRFESSRSEPASRPLV